MRVGECIGSTDHFFIQVSKEDMKPQKLKILLQYTKYILIFMSF